jgi:hypothetical protein
MRVQLSFSTFLKYDLSRPTLQFLNLTLPLYYVSLLPYKMIFFPYGATAPTGQGLLNIKASRSHSDTPHMVGLLWTSNQPDAETSLPDTKQHSKDRHPCSRRDSNPQSQKACGKQNHVLDRAATGIVAYRDDRNPVNIPAYIKTSVIVVQHSSLVSPIVDLVCDVS